MGVKKRCFFLTVAAAAVLSAWPVPASETRNETYLSGDTTVTGSIEVPEVTDTVNAGGEEAVSVGDTAVTAQVVTVGTPSEEKPDGELPGKEPSKAPSGTAPSEDAAHSGVRAGQVNTGDVGLWEPLFFLFVFSGIVTVAVKIRRLGLEEE